MKDGGYWSEKTKDLWFFGFLAFSTAAVAVLFSPYLYVLLFAVVLVVVTWPIYEAILARVRGRRALAAVLTFLAMALLVFVPLGGLVWIFVSQALAFVQDAVDFVASGQLERQVEVLQESSLPAVEAWISEYAGPDFNLIETITGPIQQGLLAILNTAGATLPTLLVTTAGVGIDIVIFVFAVISLYMEGPRVLQVVKNLSPMDDEYEDQLFGVFRQFSNNMVLGSLATGALQGLVAGLGYAIAGVDQVVLWAILTGVCSFVPLVGTMVVWIPIAIGVGIGEGIGWAAFVAVWSIVVTSSVDNVVKPLFLRGGTNIHPLLIFLGVFGGLAWMSVPGVLVGPVIVAFFLALYTIYVHDYLGVERPPPDTGPGWIDRLRARFAPAPAPLAVEEAPAPEPEPEPEEDPPTTS